MRNQRLQTNIKSMRLIPLRPDEMTDEITMEKLVRLQNGYLDTTEAITLFNIRRTYWFLPGKNVTFRTHLLEAKNKREGSFLIKSMEIVEDVDMILFLVEKRKKNMY